MPNRLNQKLVDAVRSHTSGAKIFATSESIPAILSASSSAFFIATRFGTSSPKTRLKYAKINVITTMHADFNASSAIGIPVPLKSVTNGCAKFSAANALCKNPASVIATWIVARNFAGCFMSASSFPARLSPASQSCRSFKSLIEITAISALANTAFKKIKTINKNMGCNMSAPFCFRRPVIRPPAVCYVLCHLRTKRYDLPASKKDLR